jgi:hypothetical protein
MKVNIGPYSKKKDKERKISIRIDPYDVWSMDETLALIIHPMLIQLKKSKMGAPYTDDEDVPEHLRSTSAPPKKDEFSTDDFHFDRWDWILDEMIWAFSQVNNHEIEDSFYSGVSDISWKERNIGGEVLHEMIRGPNDTRSFDKEGWEQWNERKRNGFKLFGKYYSSLWD